MRNVKTKHSIPASRARSGKSSLLIPAEHMNYFFHQCNVYGGRAAYFGMMVQHYLPQMDRWQSHLIARRDPNWKTIYQEQNLSLVKRSFIPAGSDWECFRNAACACGVSMCYLFVFLMELEMQCFFQKSSQKSPGERNSFPESVQKLGKLGKFSIFGRKMDVQAQTLTRTHQIG